MAEVFALSTSAVPFELQLLEVENIFGNVVWS